MHIELMFNTRSLLTKLNRTGARAIGKYGCVMKYVCLACLVASSGVGSAVACDIKMNPQSFSATVEITAGSNRKWEVNKETGELEEGGGIWCWRKGGGLSRVSYKLWVH